jgi:hypothetical protein
MTLRLDIPLASGKALPERVAKGVIPNNDSMGEKMATLIEEMEETSAAASRSLELAKGAEQEVLTLECQHASLLSRISNATALVVSGGEIDEDLSNLGQSAGDIAKTLADKRIQLAECERQVSATTLAANKATFLVVAAEAQEHRERFHRAYRECCLSFGQLMENINTLTALASACRLPSFGLRNDQKNTLADFNSEDSLNPLKALQDEFEPTRQVEVSKITAISAVQVLPLVPKITPKGKR